MTSWSSEGWDGGDNGGWVKNYSWRLNRKNRDGTDQKGGVCRNESGSRESPKRRHQKKFDDRLKRENKGWSLGRGGGGGGVGKVV